MTEKTEAALRNRIDELMQAGVSANMKKLDEIYHRDLRIMMLAPDGQLMSVDKPGCLDLLQRSFEGKNPEDHMWAKLHDVSVSGDRGHVLISRKIPIDGPQMMIDLSIDLVFEDGRWQVIREVNIAHPDTEAA